MPELPADYQAFRTNRSGASIRFDVRETNVVGLDFGDAYKANLDNEPNVQLQLPRIVYRYYLSSQSSRPIPWSKPVKADGRVIIATALDSSQRYTVEVRVLEVGDVIQTPSRQRLLKTERFREPEEGLPSQYGESPDPVEGFGPSGGFIEAIGLVCSSTAVVSAPTSDFAADLNVLVYGDLTTDASMYVEQVPLTSGRDTRVSDAASKNFIRLACEAAADFITPKRNLVVTNLSWNNQFIHRFDFPSVLSGTFRYATTNDFKAGFATNPLDGAQVDGFELQSYPGFMITDDLNTDVLNGNGPIGPAMFDRLTETRQLDAGYVPDVVIIALGSGTQISSIVDASFSFNVATNTAALINEIRAKWGDVGILVVGPHYDSGLRFAKLLDTSAEDEPVQDGMLTAVAVLDGVSVPATSLDFVNIQTAVAAAPENLGEFRIVLTEAQHAYLATTLQTALETMLDNATYNPGAPSYDFQVATNSQYIATF